MISIPAILASLMFSAPAAAAPANLSSELSAIEVRALLETARAREVPLVESKRIVSSDDSWLDSRERIGALSWGEKLRRRMQRNKVSPQGWEDDAWIDYFRSRALDLDWEMVFGGKRRVIFLGEQHESRAMKRELAAHLKEAVKAGMTHFAAEIGANIQRTLDEPVSAAYREKLVNALQEEGFGYRAEWYADVYIAAKNEGLKVIGIDISSAEKEQRHNDCRWNRRMGPDECSQFVGESRNPDMAANINKILKGNPNSRVLAFMGAAHVIEAGQPSIMREKYGVAVRGYTFVYQNDMKDYIEKAGLSKRRVAIPTAPENTRYDALIWIPELASR